MPPARSSGAPHTLAARRSEVVLPRLVSPEKSMMKFESVGRNGMSGGISAA